MSSVIKAKTNRVAVETPIANLSTNRVLTTNEKQIEHRIKLVYCLNFVFAYVLTPLFILFTFNAQINHGTLIFNHGNGSEFLLGAAFYILFFCSLLWTISIIYGAILRKKYYSYTVTQTLQILPLLISFAVLIALWFINIFVYLVADSSIFFNISEGTVVGVTALWSWGIGFALGLIFVGLGLSIWNIVNYYKVNKQFKKQ